jgi:hypothetical protein
VAEGQGSERVPPHPAAGHLHLDTLWSTALAETSERGIYHRACRARSSRLPSLPQASRSYGPPPPPVPRLAHSGGPQSWASPAPGGKIPAVYVKCQSRKGKKQVSVSEAASRVGKPVYHSGHTHGERDKLCLCAQPFPSSLPRYCEPGARAMPPLTGVGALRAESDLVLH